LCRQIQPLIYKEIAFKPMISIYFRLPALAVDCH
jgi:hypothetical protein